MESENEKSDIEVNEEIELCMVCEENPSKYKCPGCFILTCSVHCCKGHKIKTGCTGKRDRAAFVPIQGFSDKHLRNDFHFLEDVSQSKTSANRTLIATGGAELKRKAEMKHKLITKSTSLQDVLSSSNKIQYHSASSSRLLKAAQKHEVKLSLMPSGMSKRVSNTSRYHKNIDKIYWKVHVIFILNETFITSNLLQYDLNGLNNNSSLLGLTSTNEVSNMIKNNCVDEEITLSDLTSQFLSTTSDQLAHRHHLRYLRSKKDSLKCIIHKIPSPASRPIFYEIPMNFSLRSALAGKCVIEYPTLIIGPEEFMTNIELFVREINPNSPNVSSLNMNEINLSPKRLSTTNNSIDSNEILIDSPVKKRRVSNIEGEIIEGEIIDDGLEEVEVEVEDNYDVNDNDNDDEGGLEEYDQNENIKTLLTTTEDNKTDENEDEEEESDEEFIKQLELLQNQDISSLKQLIVSMENNT